MPIYEYRCQSCEHELEKLQKLSDPPLTDCPECGRPELRKLVSAAGFRLKGGGWYETDFKKDRKRNIAGDGESKSESKSESGGESASQGKSGEKSSTTDGGSTKSGDGKAA